jgi:hypothetical protein
MARSRRARPVTPDLFVVNVDGTGRMALTNRPDRGDYPPVWSPDGTNPGEAGPGMLRLDPAWDGLRSDLRFRSLLRGE